MLWNVVLLGCCACTTSQDRTTLLEVSPRSVVLPHGGGDEWIELQVDGTWTSEVSPPIAREWLTTEPASGGAGKHRVLLRVAPNADFERREASVYFDAAELSQTVAITQAPTLVMPGRLELPALNTTEYLTAASASEPLEVALSPQAEWCTAVVEGARIHIRVSTNLGAERSVTLRVTAGRFTQDVVLVQQAFDPVKNYGDGEVVALQRATSGNGVCLVVVGDGYTLAEMARGTGKYESDMRRAAEAFFSVYPYNAYRSYFDVYMLTAISEEAGMSCVSPSETVDTKFSTLWQGVSTSISCDDGAVRDWLRRVTALTGRRMQDLTVVMPINRAVYAGTSLMWTDGFSISMIPVGSSFDKLVVHEAGGHGFAKLLDEYVYYETEIPAKTRSEIESLKNFGFYINADFSPDISRTTWRDFAAQPDYPMVGTYPGAGTYRSGIWRAEENSCMNDNVAYFNAPSRWAQIRRIRKLAGEPDYTFGAFLLEDQRPAYPAGARSGIGDLTRFVPSGPPVVITEPSDK